MLCMIRDDIKIRRLGNPKKSWKSCTVCLVLVGDSGWVDVQGATAISEEGFRTMLRIITASNVYCCPTAA